MIKLLGWILLIYLVSRFVRNIMSPAPTQQGEPYREPNRREGETRVENKQSTSSSKRDGNDDDGEYIDYKEVK